MLVEGLLIGMILKEQIKGHGHDDVEQVRLVDASQVIQPIVIQKTTGPVTGSISVAVGALSCGAAGMVTPPSV